MKDKHIYALTDYKGYFGSKYSSIPYNSGMDKDLLQKSFMTCGFTIEFIPFPEVMSYPCDFWKDTVVIYTSAEDTGYYYKSFIEDLVYYLELSDARVIPAFRHLKANNNKVFMELLRQQISNDLHNFRAKVFGCFEEAENTERDLKYPLVYKTAAGAMSKGVGLIKNKNELAHCLKKISRTPDLFRELWEYGRSIKYKGYIKESRYRKKFILQEFISNLDGDFKVLVFSNKYYVLKRNNRENDFRASGSGIRQFIKDIPAGLLKFAKSCSKLLDVPNVSLDIGYSNESFFLIEFQGIYFGSFTLTHSDFFWQNTEADYFILTEGKSVLEAEYARSIAEYCTLQ